MLAGITRLPGLCAHWKYCSWLNVIITNHIHLVVPYNPGYFGGVWLPLPLVFRAAISGILLDFLATIFSVFWFLLFSLLAILYVLQAAWPLLHAQIFWQLCCSSLPAYSNNRDRSGLPESCLVSTVRVTCVYLRGIVGLLRVDYSILDFINFLLFLKLVIHYLLVVLQRKLKVLLSSNN